MAYTRYIYRLINWLNKSESLATPLGKANLNHMESGIYNIAENLDVVYNEMSTGKFDKSDAGKVIVGMPTWNPNTGVLTFKFYDGTVFQVDFNVEKIPVSFSMDSAGVITMTTSDGTQWTADIGDAIPSYTFKDTDTIAFSDEKNGNYAHTVSAQIRKGSITGDYLRPDYLNDVTTQANNAKASAANAKEYEDSAAYDAKLAQSYAVGGSGIREGENEDCAKTYKEKAEQAAEEAGEYLADLQSVQVTGVKGNSETTYRKGNVNITPANIGAAPTSHASTATTYGVSTAANYGHAMASSTTPKANGTAAVGAETAKFARGDHVHPLQTSVSGSSGSCTGNAATATKATQDGNGNTISTTYLKNSGGTVTGTIFLDSNKNSYLSGNSSQAFLGTKGNVAQQTGTSSGAQLIVDQNVVYGELSIASSSGTNVSTLLLGNSGHRWGQIYSTNSTISTSDRNMKHDISYFGQSSNDNISMTDDQLEDFVMGLMPCTYRLNDGTSGRPHHGFIAQDIEELLQKIGLADHAAFIKSPKTKDVEIEKEIEAEEEDPDTGESRIVKKVVKELQHEEISGEYIYSLRYEEFIADIIRFVQIQKKRADNLEERLAVSEQKNLELEKRLEALEQLSKYL